MASAAYCPFCQLENQVARVVEETAICWAILSNPRLLIGHILVIPKRHIEKPWELSDIERLEVLRLVDKYRQRLLENGANGVDIRQNYRPFLAQNSVKVDHVHFHVLPRTMGDEMFELRKFELELFTELSDEEREEVLAFLKDN